MKKIGAVLRESISQTIKTNIENRGDIFMLSYSKVSSSQMNIFRKALRRAGAKIYVSKNKISKRILKDLSYDRLADKVAGQTAFVWCESDTAEISKALTKFSKECENVKIQGGLLQGKILELADIKRLSDLPSRDVLLSTLLGTIQSPITRFMGALNGKTQDLLSILKQLSEKK